jgi:arginase family enzyme
MLAAIARRGKIIAFYVAELNPPADSSGATARLATWLITHLLSGRLLKYPSYLP